MSDYIDAEIEDAVKNVSQSMDATYESAANIVQCCILENSLYHLSRIADSLEQIGRLMQEREDREGGAA
jgi:hypothetical protein